MTKPLTATHGTHGGIGIHRRLKEPNCDLCAAFKKEYQAAQYQLNREKNTAQAREYHHLKKNNPEYKARRAEWQRNNKKKYQQWNRDGYRRNPEQVLRRNHKRRALMKGNGSEPYTTAQVLEEYGAVCYLCEEPIDLTLPRKIGTQGWGWGLHLDHVIPITKGGKDCLENVAPTHAICNLSKRGN